MRKTKYLLLSTLSFIVSIIGYLGLKLAIIGVTIGVALLSEKYIGEIGITFGYILGLFTGGILFTGLQKLYPYIEKLDNYVKTHKDYPYTKRFGKNYPHPEPKDFDISETEFKEYNKRFQFEFIRIIFTYGVCITGSIYLITIKVKGVNGILLLGSLITTAVLLDYLFEYLNTKISMRHQHFKKINKFQQSLRIYYKIRNENSKI
ncbi:hypothetical protein WG904_18640 [Pedobacter sp. Du54]|uniref:hypothetical protein n=1 Tax=Pedobacter anseongensis TaxID=3133439 RepID=UPI0030B70C71